jgi:hypothetical protein
MAVSLVSLLAEDTLRLVRFIHRLVLVCRNQVKVSGSGGRKVDSEEKHTGFEVGRRLSRLDVRSCHRVRWGSLRRKFEFLQLGERVEGREE